MQISIKSVNKVLILIVMEIALRFACKECLGNHMEYSLRERHSVLILVVMECLGNKFVAVKATCAVES